MQNYTTSQVEEELEKRKLHLLKQEQCKKECDELEKLLNEYGWPYINSENVALYQYEVYKNYLKEKLNDAKMDKERRDKLPEEELLEENIARNFFKSTVFAEIQELLEDEFSRYKNVSKSDFSTNFKWLQLYFKREEEKYKKAREMILNFKSTFQE